MEHYYNEMIHYKIGLDKPYIRLHLDNQHLYPFNKPLENMRGNIIEIRISTITTSIVLASRETNPLTSFDCIT